MNNIKTNPHHHNLGKIDDTLWKHKITITTSLRSNHANAFGVHKLCGCFAKTILRHQKQYDNEPLGFISFEYTKSDNLHFHSIWTQLNGVDEINKSEPKRYFLALKFDNKFYFERLSSKY